MKKLILFSIISIINSLVFACGYYPSGEDIRFNLLKPNLMKLKGFDSFHYTFFEYFDSQANLTTEELAENDENVNLWYNYFNQKVDKKSIYEAIYQTNSKTIKRSSNNKFIKLLNQPENKEIKDYLEFAVKCSPLNSYFSDPWEKNIKFDKIYRNKAITKALNNCKKTKNSELQRRYAYLALRLSYYNHDKKKVNELYERFFKNSPNKNALDYWALHFKLQFDDSSEKRNIDIANVFANSCEKRYASHFFFDRDVDFEKSLSLSSSNDEKAALHLIYASRKVDHALSNIQEFEKLSNNQNQLLFLTLREINKLEDWILTPYYSLFEPSLSDVWYGEQRNLDTIEAKIKADKSYAFQVANWMNQVQNSSLEWATLKNYAYFLSGKTANLESEVKMLLKKIPTNSDLRAFNQELLALIQLRNSKTPNLNEKSTQEILVDAPNNKNQFYFAVARELEYKGNLVDASFILSQMSDDYYWKSTSGKTTLRDDYFYNYFYYLDANYSIQDIQQIILEINSTPENSDFNNWKINFIKNDLARIYDLLGTKYLRKNDLQNALKSYELIDKTLWGNEFWDSEHTPFKIYLNANPFYTNLFNEHTPTIGDTITYTKPQIIEKLISLKKQLSTSTDERKSYLNFHIANCYLNMTQYGNSWMMKRYYWTSTESHTGLEDDQEYFECNLAKKYYLDAYYTAQNDKIKALSLRMAGRCEKYRLLDLHREDYITDEKAKELFFENKLYRKLKNEFPEHYEPLVSNCESFNEYYSAF